MELNLRKESWENIIKVVQQSGIVSEGNFWASIQSLEGQLEEKDNEHKRIIKES